MKKRDLEKQLREYGWRFARHGGNHDAWTNGEVFEFVPRHAEIKEMLAKKILKNAKIYPKNLESWPIGGIESCRKSILA